MQNYTQSFGLQWKKFSKTQMDDTDQKQSETRFFATTNWRPEELAGNIDSLITIFDFLVKARLGVLTRFLPIVDLRTIPSTVDKQKRRE